MTYDMYRLIFIVGAIACAIMFLVSVILFVALKIPYVIGDLSGRNAKKAIEEIRRQNEISGDKVYKSSAVNLERGKLTDKISASGRIQNQYTSSGFGMRTEKISTMELEETTNDETTVLGQNQNNMDETTVLTETSQELLGDETTVLNNFILLEQITFINTEEYI